MLDLQRDMPDMPDMYSIEGAPTSVVAKSRMDVEDVIKAMKASVGNPQVQEKGRVSCGAKLARCCTARWGGTFISGPCYRNKPIPSVCLSFRSKEQDTPIS